MGGGEFERFGVLLRVISGAAVRTPPRWRAILDFGGSMARTFQHLVAPRSAWGRRTSASHPVALSASSIRFWSHRVISRESRGGMQIVPTQLLSY